MKPSLQQCFGTVVRTHRAELGISQEDLADRTGLHRTYISLLERGQRNPSLAVIDVLANALGMEMADMLREVQRVRNGR